jgi:hypothetical protein
MLHVNDGLMFAADEFIRLLAECSVFSANGKFKVGPAVYTKLLPLKRWLVIKYFRVFSLHPNKLKKTCKAPF